MVIKRGKISFQVQGIALPQALVGDLRGKQSVRVTFKLPEDTINTVSIVASHLGIKQKSLFDHLMADLDVLRSIASEIEGVDRHKSANVQKTYVISRKSLDYLESVAQQFRIPRDLLVEYSVQRLLPIVEKERLQNVKRKKVFAQLQEYLHQGQNLLNDSINTVGKDDLTINMLYSVLSSTETTTKQLDILIKKGEMIEELLK